MTAQQAEQHLRERAREMDKRYRDQYFKWSTTDLVAVKILLRENVNLQVSKQVNLQVSKQVADGALLAHEVMLGSSVSVTDLVKSWPPARRAHDPGNPCCPRNADPRNESCGC